MSGRFSVVASPGETGAAHLRILETLSLAIEVQGSHAPDHLLRTGHYARELGERLGLDQAGLGNLRLAAILHDVGELAVPQSILFKAGGLTPLEFERMMAHAPVGALLMDSAGLPREAAAMVRSHHERWDGTGAPDGLRQEAIPLGARILAVADCLAGASGGMALPALLSGKDTLFDPRIVQIAVECHDAIQCAVREASTRVAPDFRAAISAARREERVLCQLTGDLGTSLTLPETLSTFDGHLKNLIAYDCLAVYQAQNDRLSPVYVNGESSQAFSSLGIPWGQGPAGMAAATREPVLNGDPAADAAHAAASLNPVPLRSTLALSLDSGEGPIAVLALYHTARDAFRSEDLRILLAIRARLAVAVEHALQHERADKVASVDTLTGLPNRRALFHRLDAELARCRRSRTTMAVLVCEIGGLSDIERRSATAGAHLCKAIATGLRQMCREEDCVARMGEGFVLALSGFSARDLPEKRERMESLLAGLTPTGGCPLVARLGAAYYPVDGVDAEDLLACADSRVSAAPGAALHAQKSRDT